MFISHQVEDEEYCHKVLKYTGWLRIFCHLAWYISQAKAKEREKVMAMASARSNTASTKHKADSHLISWIFCPEILGKINELRF